MNIELKEAFRYLRMKESDADDSLRELMTEICRELETVVEPKVYAREFSCQVEEDFVAIDGVRIESRKLARHLRGCEKVICFGATLGTGADRLGKRYQVLDRTKMVMLQSAAAAAIEAFCDEEQQALAERYAKDGYYLKPRFSPGYADCSLTYQKELFRVLEAEKRLGITLTKGYMMVPTKSVTAWIGVTREPNCHVKKCATCAKTDCEFREV